MGPQKSEPEAPPTSTPSVVKDIPVSKVQQDALSKDTEEGQASAPKNDTPSLSPEEKAPSKASSNDIEALYLKEVAHVSDTVAEPVTGAPEEKPASPKKVEPEQQEAENAETRNEAGQNSPKV